MRAKDCQFAHWTGWFTDEDVKPTLFAVNGLTCATDGRMCVVASGPACEPAERSKTIARLLGLESLESLVIPCRTLADAVGSCMYSYLDTCDRCNGDKEIVHHCDCELCKIDYEECAECDATGMAETIPDARRRLLLGKAIDANRVAYLLEKAPAQETVSVEIIEIDKRGDIATFRFVAADWTAMVMGMTNRVELSDDNGYGPLVELMPAEMAGLES